MSVLQCQEVSGQYKSFTGMFPVDFDYILRQLEGDCKNNSHLSKSISAQRLATRLCDNSRARDVCGAV